MVRYDTVRYIDEYKPCEYTGSSDNSSADMDMGMGVGADMSNGTYKHTGRVQVQVMVRVWLRVRVWCGIGAGEVQAWVLRGTVVYGRVLDSTVWYSMDNTIQYHNIVPMARHRWQKPTTEGITSVDF